MVKQILVLLSSYSICIVNPRRMRRRVAVEMCVCMYLSVCYHEIC